MHFQGLEKMTYSIIYSLNQTWNIQKNEEYIPEINHNQKWEQSHRNEPYPEIPEFLSTLNIKLYNIPLCVYMEELKSNLNNWVLSSLISLFSSSFHLLLLFLFLREHSQWCCENMKIKKNEIIISFFYIFHIVIILLKKKR